MAITNEALAEIKERATHLFPEMRSNYVDKETKGFQRIEELDAEGVPQEVVDSIKERCLRADNYWRFSAAAECIEKDIAGYRFLLNYSNSRISTDRLLEIKEEAARVYPRQYFSQKCRLESLVEDEKNQLHIFNGLLKVVEHLQARYGLDLTKERHG